MSTLEVCWTGSSWRAFPTRIGTLPSRRMTPRPRLQSACTRILDSLPPHWVSLRAVMDRAGVSDKTARTHLERLIMAGDVEALPLPVTKPGRPGCMYRRIPR